MDLILVYLLIAALLLLLNAFFVLAEFALVKMRPSRVEEMVDDGIKRAVVVQHLQMHMDEYLSVCQVGITFASIGLGFVGEPAFAQLLIKAFHLSEGTAHGVATAIAYVLVSFLHILLGELVPKSVAIRRSEGAALWTALPLRFFRMLFWAPLTILNGSANLILRIIGLPVTMKEAAHSEEELKILLAKSQSSGMMSFRRLLFLENIFDLGDVKVGDAMRSRDSIKTLKLGAPWEENVRVIRQSRFSRYPLIGADPEKPLGVVHVKDLLYEGPEKMATVDLAKIARPYLTVRADAPLENLMAELQRRRGHLAVVHDAKGRWVGFITLEDVVEEIIGTIEDEFEVEPPIFIADALTEARVINGIKAKDLVGAISQTLKRVPKGEFPLDRARIEKAVIEREIQMSTYLGNGLAVPHARIEGLEKPLIIFASSEEGIPVRGREERARMIFILLTPTGSPRIQVRLLSRICGLMESEFVVERLMEAKDASAVLEAIKAGDPVTLG